MRPVELRDAGGSLLLTLTARETDPVDAQPTRNLEAVQPRGGNVQAAFGSGILQVGGLERDLALCNVSSYTSLFHAKAAYRTALDRTAELRYEGWSLPIAGAVGIANWRMLRIGLLARISLIPRSAHWRYLTGSKAGTGSQAGATITGAGFASTDVGRVLVFANGAEALITGFSSSTELTTDIEQTVGSQAYTVYDAVEGLL